MLAPYSLWHKYIRNAQFELFKVTEPSGDDAWADPNRRLPCSRQSRTCFDLSRVEHLCAQEAMTSRFAVFWLTAWPCIGSLASADYRNGSFVLKLTIWLRWVDWVSNCNCEDYSPSMYLMSITLIANSRMQSACSTDRCVKCFCCEPVHWSMNNFEH